MEIGPLAPILAGIGTWLLQQGQTVWNHLLQKVVDGFGFKAKTPAKSEQSVLLVDRYLKELNNAEQRIVDRIVNRIDQERISEMYGALEALKQAPRTGLKRELLSHAFSVFLKIINIPENKDYKHS